MKNHLIIHRRSISKLSETFHKDSQKIVFTNGCFDIVHIGHITYLEQAKSLGDILVVGINSDRSVNTIKDTKRPLVNEKERAKIIASLHCVDFAVIFDEPTPERLISELKPDIHVKGGDYIAKRLPEYETVKAYGGDVRILPYVPRKSTTNIIKRILERYGK